MKTSILENAKNLTVINDGAVQYPVITAEMTAWVAANGEITADNYEAFCAAVECVGERESGTVGSGAMIDLCNDLVAAGADSVRL